MTLQELYQSIGGDYEQALRVLRMDKLIDKHIRKLAGNGVVDRLLSAGKTMDAVQLFEAGAEHTADASAHPKADIAKIVAMQSDCKGSGLYRQDSDSAGDGEVQREDAE